MDILLTLQGWRNPVLDGFFYALTQLGSEEFILAFLAVVYWCVNRTTGLQLGLVLLGSQYLNEGVKGLTQVARPFTLPDSPIVPLYPETALGDSWPSGHAQNTAAVWGTLAGVLRQGWFTALAAVIIVLVGLSRLWLGVHWPVDVLSGWVIGLILVGLALVVIARTRGVTVQTVPALALVATPVVAGVLLLIQPTDTTAKVLGAALGLILGWWLERRTVGFEADAPLVIQVVKAVIGLVIAFALRIFLKPLFGALPMPELVPDLLRYLVIGLWVAWLAPSLFVQLFRRTPAPAAAEG